LAILDEMGQVKGPQDDFVDAVTTSQGAHENPLLLIISTQAPTDADLMSVWIDDATTADDPHTVCHVYTAPDDCELNDRSAWQAANPALGLFRSEKDVAEQAAQAERMPSSENTFRVLTLNQRRNLNDPFVSSNVWRENGARPEPFVGRVYGGLDLSSTTDLTSLVLIGETADGFVDVQAHFWMAQDTIRDASKRDRAPYEAWAKAGLIRTTPGTVIDYGFVARDIGVITSGLNVAGIAFDRWRMDRLQAKLDDAGVTLPLESWGQGFVSMAPALDAFEELLLQNLLRHGGNPPLNMCALNATVTKDPAGNRKLDKSRSRGRIDGMQALAMAIGLKSKQLEPAPQPTPWADENFSLADL
jgi:phage terminase large subunit-like protein